MRKEIEDLIKVLEQKKASSHKLYLENYNNKIGYYQSGNQTGFAFCINQLKEILNEAVVCGSERNQTMCNIVDKCNAENKQLTKHCFSCKKEFDFFGKEITS